MITPREHEALVTVRDALAAGEFRHSRITEGPDGPTFNMRSTCLSGDCGTIACIGGWMAITMLGLAREKPVSYENQTQVFDFVTDYGDGELLPSSPSLMGLFYPPGAREDEEWWDFITPAYAVEAIDNFLRDGDPRWGAIRRRIT